jgi:hypothetical protein
MRYTKMIIAAAIFLAPAVASAEAPASAPAAAAAAAYNSNDTELGVLLDDPAARAVLEKHLPEIKGNDQIDMGRSMTLKALQDFAPDAFTDAKLAAIDADLAKLPAKK